MPNGEHEPPASSSSERGGKEEREEKRAEERKETSKEKPSKKEAKVERAKEPLIPLKEVKKLGKESGKAAKEVRELGKAAREAKFALHELASKIKEGTIKTFDELSSSMEKWRTEFSKTGEEITNNFRRITESFDKAAEYSERTAKLQEESAKTAKRHVEDLESVYKGMRETARAAEAAGIIGPPEITRRYREEKEEEDREWFETQLRRLEEEDRSFADNWRRTWPLEQYLASIPPEKKDLYRELVQKFEDRRRLHDYQWFYKRAPGVGTIIEASAILPTGAIERTLKQEGVAESMVKLQKLSENIVGARREGKKEEETELKLRMLQLMKGEIDVDEESNEIETDEDRAAINRLGGRLFIVLGLTASYDFSEFAGGDYFVARLMHLKNRFKINADEEGKPWFGRDKLWEDFPVEIFGNDFTGGVLANLPEHKGKEDPLFNRFGLELAEEEQEDKEGRKLRVLKIVDPEKFRGLDLKKIGILQENMLTTVYADALVKADEARKAFLKPDQYLDRPTAESFFRLSATVEHLKGKKKWAFFAPLADGLIKFHKGPGTLERITRLRFFEGLKAIDPVTGEERTMGLAWIGSDAERLGLDQDWRGGEIHRFVNTIQRDNLIDRSRTEGILRRNLDIFGIPGIGPVRFTKEMWDVVGWGGLLAALFAPIYVFFAKLKEQLERS